MLDVHPPHGKLHGIGDFLLHLFTITVGLLIALGLEGCVERMHHRELRDEALHNLRQEMVDNQKALHESMQAQQREMNMLVRVLDFLEARQLGKPYDLGGTQLGFSLSTLNDASWRTANATGAVAYMDYTKVQKYADVYALQAKVDDAQSKAFDSFVDLQSYVIRSFDPARVTAAKAAQAEPDVRHALARLGAMRDLSRGLDEVYTTTLKTE